MDPFAVEVGNGEVATVVFAGVDALGKTARRKAIVITLALTIRAPGPNARPNYRSKEIHK